MPKRQAEGEMQLSGTDLQGRYEPKASKAVGHAQIKLMFAEKSFRVRLRV